jgi:hypothetical protein
MSTVVPTACRTPCHAKMVRWKVFTCLNCRTGRSRSDDLPGSPTGYAHTTPGSRPPVSTSHSRGPAPCRTRTKSRRRSWQPSSGCQEFNWWLGAKRSPACPSSSRSPWLGMSASCTPSRSRTTRRRPVRDARPRRRSCGTWSRSWTRSASTGFAHGTSSPDSQNVTRSTTLRTRCGLPKHSHSRSDRAVSRACGGAPARRAQCAATCGPTSWPRSADRRGLHGYPSRLAPARSRWRHGQPSSRAWLTLSQFQAVAEPGPGRWSG